MKKKISELEYDSLVLIQSEEQREREMEEKLNKDLDTQGPPPSIVIYVGEERNKGTEQIFEEIMAENIPNFMQSFYP